MGKGDKKTRRGKIVIGSYGKLHPRKKHKAPVIKTKVKDEVEEPVVKPKKVKAKE